MTTPYKTEYGRRRRKAMAYGTWTPPFVDAEPVRQHVRKLTAATLGIDRICELTGISRGTMRHLMYGSQRRGLGPAKQMRAHLAAKILALQPSLEILGNSAVIDATGTRRRLQALVAVGWPAARIADRLGTSRQQVQLALRRDKVTAARARDIRALYDQLWSGPCPTDRAGAKRAVSWARREGWAPPMAWDDDVIDDPKARPSGFHRAADSEVAA